MIHWKLEVYSVKFSIILLYIYCFYSKYDIFLFRCINDFTISKRNVLFLNPCRSYICLNRFRDTIGLSFNFKFLFLNVKDSMARIKLDVDSS